MSDDQHNCLHCGRAVVWSDEQKGWIDAYGNGDCRASYAERHGALKASKIKDGDIHTESVKDGDIKDRSRE